MKKLDLGWAIDVSKLLNQPEKIRNRVNAIGVELEGGWVRPPTPYRIIRDGSVKGLLGPHVGELPSPPLNIVKSFQDAEDWIRKCYPPQVNHTCGMHVHYSFDTLLNYMRVMPSEFSATIVREAARWAEEENLPKDHPIWNRLDGRSEYCQLVHSAEDQILNTGKDYDKHRVGNRYSVVNYNYGRTGTVEIRLLPMMANVELALSAIKRMLAVVNSFLVATAKREVVHEAVVETNSKATKRVREQREIYL